MHTLLHDIKSDYLKTKRTPLRIAHIAVPCVMAAVFLAYYAATPWNAYGKVQAYFEVMGMGFPFLIGTFCAMVVEQECDAGGCQTLLAVPDRKRAFSAKLLLLLLFGTCAVMAASVLFGTGFYFLLRQRMVRYSFYWIAAFVMAGSSILLYVAHMFLAFRFSGGVSVGLGIAGSLLAALGVTGLGDSIWIFLPAAWASRLVCSLLPAYSAEQLPMADYGKGAWICAAATGAAFLLYLVWCGRWDGRREKD